MAAPSVATGAAPEQSVCIVGYGRAGKARERAMKAISSRSSDVAFAGVCSRRPDVGTLPWDAAFSPSSPVTAAIICTESGTHYDLTRAALAAGKHVAVEYPLCVSAAAAHELIQLAARERRVLHVEHIELRSERQFKLAAAVATCTPASGHLEAVRMHFTGSPLASSEASGHPAFAGIARLTRLWDIFGRLNLKSATLTCDVSGGKLEFSMAVRLEPAAWPGTTLEWVEERRPGLTRDTRVYLTSGGEELEMDAFLASKGITTALEGRDATPSFELDTIAFLSKCAVGETKAEDDLALELEWLTLAEAIAAAAPVPAVIVDAAV